MKSITLIRICLLSSLFSLLLFSSQLRSQTTYSAFFGTGYAFNTKSFYLAEERMQGTDGLFLRSGALFAFPLGQLFSIETGLMGMYVSVNGKVGYSQYRSRSLKFYVPLHLGYKWNEKLSLMAGMSVRNAKDLAHFHIAGAHNLRYDVILGATYILNPSWKLMAHYNHDVGIPAAYLINDPQSSIALGLIYLIEWRSKRTAINTEENAVMGNLITVSR